MKDSIKLRKHLDMLLSVFVNKMLPDEAINEFLEIYQRKIGKRLNLEEARVLAEHFIFLYDLIITNKNNNQNHEQRINSPTIYL